MKLKLSLFIVIYSYVHQFSLIPMIIFMLWIIAILCITLGLHD